MRAISNILRDTRGATALEYGLIIALVVIAIIAGVNSVAGKTITLWGNVADQITRT